MSQRTTDGFRQFVYQGPDMLKLQLERDESEETVAHYTMGAGLEAMRRETSSFYHYNHLGTALALTGADEAVSDTYRHDAWGVLLASPKELVIRGNLRYNVYAESVSDGRGEVLRHFSEESPSSTGRDAG